MPVPVPVVLRVRLSLEILERSTHRNANKWSTTLVEWNSIGDMVVEGNGATLMNKSPDNRAYKAFAARTQQSKGVPFLKGTYNCKGY